MYMLQPLPNEACAGGAVLWHRQSFEPGNKDCLAREDAMLDDTFCVSPAASSETVYSHCSTPHGQQQGVEVVHQVDEWLALTALKPCVGEQLGVPS